MYVKKSYGKSVTIITHNTRHKEKNFFSSVSRPAYSGFSLPPHLTFTATIRHSKLNHTIPSSPSGSFHLSPGDQASPTSALATRAFCFQILFRFSQVLTLPDPLLRPPSIP